MTAKQNSISKQSFLQGTAILTVGVILSKIIGALFKIPLTRLITTEGAGHFAVAYNIYIVLLNVSSTGLPIAVSRLISEANTFRDGDRIRQVHRSSLSLFLFIGILSSGATLLFAPQIAGWMRDPDAVYGIMVLAPAVLFVCVGSAFRGYFQGLQYMTPTATAQVIEAFCKLVLGLLGAYLTMRAGWGFPAVVGASILGVTVGSFLSCVYFTVQYRRRQGDVPAAHAAPPVTRQMTGQILRLAIPITIGATGFQLINVLCSKVILGRLQDSLLLPLEQASSMLGIYTNTQTLYLLPAALAQPLAVSIVPAVTEALYLRNGSDCRNKMESAIRVVGLIAIPCGVGMFTLAAPLQGFIYGYDAATRAVAGPLLAVLGLSSILYCFILVTNALLQAHGKVYVSICTTLIGGCACVLTTYVLVGRGEVGIFGAAVGTAVYCLAAVLINILAIRALPEPPRFLPQLYKTAAAAAGMAGAAWGVYRLTRSVLISVLAAGIVYAALIYAMKVVTWYDCSLLPKGEKIAKLLRISDPGTR